MRGTLFLIVGPSGAGKDSLIGAARGVLEPLGTHEFPKRTITRPPGDSSEAHTFEDVAAFDSQERAGYFALSWRAHNLAYGVPASIAADLERGVHVVVNVSRSVVGVARARFTPSCVIEVTAPLSLRAARLRSRGREPETEVEARLARVVAVAPDIIIVNDGTLDKAAALFIAALRG